VILVFYIKVVSISNMSFSQPVQVTGEERFLSKWYPRSFMKVDPDDKTRWHKLFTVKYGFTLKQETSAFNLYHHVHLGIVLFETLGRTHRNNWVYVSRDLEILKYAEKSFLIKSEELARISKEDLLTIELDKVVVQDFLSELNIIRHNSAPPTPPPSPSTTTPTRQHHQYQQYPPPVAPPVAPPAPPGPRSLLAPPPPLGPPQVRVSKKW
jgi:hypothetical protein